MSEVEGYIKYDCNWIPSAPLPYESIKEINRCRQQLFDLGLIGAYAGGEGFGNISVRIENSTHFIISGTQTGRFPTLGPEHYTQVIDVDFEHNFLTCMGPIKASSESLTHAILYQCDHAVNAVVHVHSLDLWQALIYKLPTTKPEKSYGTLDIASDVQDLYYETDLKVKKLLVMGGHREGIIAFGGCPQEATTIICHAALTRQHV